MNGDLNAALANGAAPFIANEIKNLIPGEGTDSQLARVVAHGIANAALALAKGENAAAQATGAMTGEAIGILAESVYKKQPGELTEQEKENVSAWATLASGLAGGLVGGDTQSAANSAQAGKTTVENNSLVMLVPDIDSYSEDFKNSNDPLYKLTDAYVHELEIRAESGDQGAIIELQQREIAEENTKTAIKLYAIATGGYYAATVAPELATAAKTGAIACAENPVLCANQIGVWIIEMLGADATPAGIAITGSTATGGKLTFDKMTELAALKSMQQKGGDISPDMVNKIIVSNSEIVKLPAGTKGTVLQNALEPHEYQQALDIVKYKGGSFKGAEKANFQGIDGWLDGVPVQLKLVEGKSINAIRRNIVSGAKDMQKAGYQGDLYIDASKTGVSMKEMIDHFKPGSPVSNVTKEGTVNNIYIKTQDGWLNVTSGSITKGGER
ncbi:VENN motif pre-toxin domain-containing protein [Morganella morganii]